jgi:hypothetical protein
VTDREYLESLIKKGYMIRNRQGKDSTETYELVHQSLDPKIFTSADPECWKYADSL